jgi:hypothetical protein
LPAPASLAPREGAACVGAADDTAATSDAIIDAVTATTSGVGICVAGVCYAGSACVCPADNVELPAG